MDEAGRGALAGPVVAAACILPFQLFRRRSSPGWSPYPRKKTVDCIIADSKQLTPQARDIAWEWIVQHCAFGIGIVPHMIIESRGIRFATYYAMRRAVHNLFKVQTPHLLRVDGKDHFRFLIPSEEIIRGDATDTAIAAASILAKVTRDRIMIRSSPIFPYFGFDRHKGYGTEEHIKMIRRFGMCPIHRRNFLSRIVGNAA